jgi:uncharacterized membrane protein (DUF485 family)
MTQENQEIVTDVIDKTVKSTNLNNRNTFYENDAMNELKYSLRALHVFYFCLYIVLVIVVAYKKLYNNTNVLIMTIFLFLFPLLMKFILVDLIIYIWRRIYIYTPKNVYFQEEESFNEREYM